jgi:hypothetical protein
LVRDCSKRNISHFVFFSQQAIISMLINESDIMHFTIYIEQDKGGIYIGDIPSIPGCHTQGETQKEMLSNLSDVIKLCLRNNKK